jgi:hypothetical protein
MLPGIGSRALSPTQGQYPACPAGNGDFDQLSVYLRGGPGCSRYRARGYVGRRAPGSPDAGKEQGSVSGMWRLGRRWLGQAPWIGRFPGQRVPVFCAIRHRLLRAAQSPRA